MSNTNGDHRVDIILERGEVWAMCSCGESVTCGGDHHHSADCLSRACPRYVGDLAQIVYDIAVDHPMWIGDDGQELGYLPERESRISDFIEEVRLAIAAALEDR